MHEKVKYSDISVHCEMKSFNVLLSYHYSVGSHSNYQVN